MQQVQNEYNINRKWSDRFIPQIKSILGQYFIGEDAEEDCLRNTDLIVLNLKPYRFACRVRRFEYSLRYGDEFTLRVKSKCGQDTEIHKVINGFGDYFFYGFSNQEETEIFQWIIGDLSVFRVWFRKWRETNPGEFARRQKNNNDGTALAVFRNREVPGFVKYSLGVPKTFDPKPVIKVRDTSLQSRCIW